jgi:hypothetical protein
MKKIRVLLSITAAAASLIAPRAALADDTTTTPPTVVPQDRDDRDLLRDLRGVPDNIKTLILNFDQIADKYLAEQRKLLKEYKAATTPEQRAAIREQLQDNRQAFLAELKSFRQQLMADLKDLKGKISHAEFRRIIDAAHDAAAPAGNRHKGHK